MIHPLWEKIQGIKFGPGNYTGIVREVSKCRTPSDRVLFHNGLGYLTSHAASRGFDDINENTMICFYRDCKRWFDRNPGKRFKDFKDYARTKIKRKKRQYNKG